MERINNNTNNKINYSNIQNKTKFLFCEHKSVKHVHDFSVS